MGRRSGLFLRQRRRAAASAIGLDKRFDGRRVRDAVSDAGALSCGGSSAAGCIDRAAAGGTTLARSKEAAAPSVKQMMPRVSDKICRPWSGVERHSFHSLADKWCLTSDIIGSLLSTEPIRLRIFSLTLSRQWHKYVYTWPVLQSPTPSSPLSRRAARPTRMHTRSLTRPLRGVIFSIRETWCKCATRCCAGCAPKVSPSPARLYALASRDPPSTRRRPILLGPGLVGLLPTKRGPHGAHKITAEVLRFIQDLRVNDPERDVRQLIEDIAARFGLAVHRRTVERALARSKKKRP